MRVSVIAALVGSSLFSMQGRATPPAPVVEQPKRVLKTPVAHPLTSSLRKANSVVAYRVDMKMTGNQIEFVARPEGKKLGPMEQARLAQALNKVDFHPDTFKACMFAPGIEYRFMAGKDEITLQVCFQCSDLKYIGGGGSDTVDFGPVRAELRDIAKSAFPDLGLQSNAESEALFLQASDLDRRGQTANSIRIYRRAARAGSGKAAARLGEIYDMGINGVPSDKAEAAAWFKTARELGGQIPSRR